MSEVLLQLSGVRHVFDETAVLEAVDLQVMAGEHTLIEGPSGSGKTTLLNIAGALLSPTGGSVLFAGAPLTSVGDLARHRLLHIGFVFQEFHLIESLTARQNLELVRCARGGEPKHTLAQLLDPLGLQDRLDAPVRTLSRGERQRVALARAFANGPKLVLADEPTASLDPSRASATLDHLFTLAGTMETTVVMVSHDPGLGQRSEWAHRLLLEDGRLSAR
jgi:ABC-type lipoprotein export system ATPase subunit